MRNKMEKCCSIDDYAARPGGIWGLRWFDMKEVVVMAIFLIGNSVLKRLFTFWNEACFTCKALQESKSVDSDFVPDSTPFLVTTNQLLTLIPMASADNSATNLDNIWQLLYAMSASCSTWTFRKASFTGWEAISRIFSTMNNHEQMVTGISP